MKKAKPQYKVILCSQGKEITEDEFAKIVCQSYPGSTLKSLDADRNSTKKGA